ncbi:Zn(II)2Cys6 transcription factor domain-containing protein [Aspergillus clavatus NRRL 1]|uniref:C6 finger domain protein, putative n=1 Tax=Aspergillus clavatus (strain ATCC 1007 / CBS 513.65 / DSM 816 / NCTC 3887 / NRRL 1 / QM 1276 / 107) TaxID=344612 RepID=A1CHX7_ASPCL|nr:C6 finger domain protein, putative [Aspergillus clavatus NRRL 1]EAW10482.1 C6 finger domain protein, putative [Aspergillus clavatus NRRL 1]
MSNVDLTTDGFIGLESDSRNYIQPQSWPVAVDHQNTQRTDGSRDISPLQTSGHAYEHSIAQDPSLMVDWHFQQLQPHLQYTHEDPSSAQQFATSSYGMPIHSSPVDIMAAPQGPMGSGLLESSYMPVPAPVDLVSFGFQDLPADLMTFPDGLPDLSSYTTPQNMIGSSSPTDTYLEVRSLSSSDNGWSTIETRHPHEFMFPDQGIFINPTQTLHDRSLSESSYSTSYGSFVEISNPINSPSSDTNFESAFSMPRRVSYDHTSHGSRSPTAVSPVAIVRPMPVPSKKSTSPTRSAGTQSSSSSPPSRKPSRKSPIAAKTAETKIRKQSQTGKPEGEKRVGKRKGPLKPDQRKQASEIRKLRACLRCKFLKKTCDKGEPCAGCQPSHARLWQVPCTRIDIKEIGYFMKDWKADYERHITLGFSVGNIKGFSEHERTLFITHGYGQILPINAREVYVRDEQCFSIDWVESMHRDPTQYEVETAKLSAGMEGISHAMLSDYLDRHIDGNGTFEKFVDDYFEGTPFLTQMLKTAFRYYFRTKLPVIRKALKLVIAYNLTLHVTMVEGLGEEEGFLGKIVDPSSKFKGKIMAPVMINFQIKCAMANMWRELQKDVLEELSSLFSSVYSGEKLKNWPTIFILACILLAVWEEMQFDCHYRTPDAAAVDKFCNDMESTPVGVIVGLFQAISQKLPAFTDWETQKHHHLLYSNPDVCNTMTEVREHVKQYESYLRSRSNSKFDRNDFDCLSNKFVSRLVVRAN